MNTIYADIITIGDEILYGQITDTNSQWISAELDKIGIRTKRKSSVSDKAQDILELLAEAELRSDIILITGGLGPTNDDITKKTLASYFGSSLELHKEALAQVTEFFSKRDRTLTDTNRTQAFLPKNCTYLPNLCGTAPGMWFEHRGKIIVSMPGVPFEMKDLMTLEVLPRLKNYFKPPVIVHQLVKTIGIGESNLADLIKTWEAQLPEELSLAYLPSLGEVKLRISAQGNDQEILKSKINIELEKLLPIVEPYLFSLTDDPLEKVLGEKLASNGLSIATAESCTGGYLSHLFTSIAGSSNYFKGSVVAYDNEIKRTILEVSPSILQNDGAVSEACVLAMASSIRTKFCTDIGVAVSGIAGPGGGTAEKPVGTVWIAFANDKKSIAKKLQLGTKRENNIRLASYALLDLIRKEM